ncbi:MAG: benzoyl-CoA-dihydrodiol lyase, partial [Deltaproteobacteria bacterium]|nr:benzoyl-CoA-dihydrodiol lyase [Deltaproteobacteria bacterium]
MDTPATAPAAPLVFDTHPSRYRHWTFKVDGELATMILKVQPFGGANTELELKSNSYDLSVDVELHDALERLRFTHPGVKTVVITSGHDKVFCAGANIYMLAASSHPFKVNFCKYTNETRLYLEEASAQAGIKFLAACNGACAGGGYELALACDDIVLVDDGSSTVSLPEVPLLGVLPGTGGLTRVVDKRKVRRDLADAFSTLAEGIKGKRAVEWNLVDAVLPRSKFADGIAQRAKALVAKAQELPRGPGIELPGIEPKVTAGGLEYTHVSVKVDAKTRTGELTVRAPSGAQPQTAAEAQVAGASWWPIAMAR